MNFYEYYQTDEELTESPVYLAAKDLISNGFHVIPLLKGAKEPANIKSIYEVIANPINTHNVDFYFKDRGVDLGIILDANTEFIDIDSKNKPGVEKFILNAIRVGWEELYNKLVIDFTPSGGCHIIYRSEITGGKVNLAKVPATPHPKTIVERISRHNKQYIKISPSDGYELKQGNPFTIPFITAEERNWLCAVAASFNQVHQPEVKKKEAEREDSPWSVFNRTHDWKWMRNELVDRHWQIVADREDKVAMRRPGDTMQKYSGFIYKDSNTLYLFTSSSEFENERPYSPFGLYCHFTHDGNVAAACRQLASEGCGKNIFDEGDFWKREKGKIKIKYTELLSWLHSIGYCVYNNTLVQVTNNIVRICEEADLKRAFLNEVEFEIKDEMFEKVSTIFSDNGGLVAMLRKLPDNFISDSKDATWLFFKNIALRITATSLDPVEYKTIDGYIWESEIIAREYYGTDHTGCDADRFINILGGDNASSLQKIIGYMISRYKDPLNPRAVILMEDIDPEQEGESQGGSGKGLCFQLVKQFRKSTDMDGKNFRFSDPFLWQNVDPDTQIILIDDVEKNFKFSALFSSLTGPLHVNKKNKPQVILPFERSPKIGITSNYSVGGMDASTRRRKYEFPVVKYFGEDKEPIQEFGRQFFADWDTKEWLRFDNYIIHCCQQYLLHGDKRSIGVVTTASAERGLISNTSRDFVEYMDGQMSANFFDFAPNFLKNTSINMPDGSLFSNAVNIKQYQQHIEDPDYYFTCTKQWLLEKISKLSNYRHLTTTRLTQWFKLWAAYRDVSVDTSYKRDSDGERRYRIIEWNYYFGSEHKREKSLPSSGNEDDPPF
jgi:hypothetical protein